MALANANVTPSGSSGDLDAGHEVDPDHRERERCEVAARARSQRRQADDRQELDRRDRRQRLPADREIETAVHQCEDAPPGQQQTAAVEIEGDERAPGAAPGGEDQRRGSDAQPRDAEHLHACEQQHGEGRA